MDDPEGFPSGLLLSAGFGRERRTYCSCLRINEARLRSFWSVYLAAGSKVALPGSWGVVVTTHFQACDYREFLSNSWEGWPWDEIVQLVVAEPAK